jgi:hypothetical protein
MAYSEALDSRIAEIVSGWRDVSRKKMFGGVCYLLRGNMVCGVYKEFVILRLGGEGASQALDKPFVRPFDITGRPMKGWVVVGPQGFEGDALEACLNKAKAFVQNLPPK